MYSKSVIEELIIEYNLIHSVQIEWGDKSDSIPKSLILKCKLGKIELFNEVSCDLQVEDFGIF